jgi:hypothetical protein
MRVVVGIWLLLLVGALTFVGRYGSWTPYMDQWGEIVPLFTGERTVTLAWLWAQHNEHRLPLAKLVEATLVRAAGGDFRAGMLFNVALLGTLGLALPLALGRLRGRVVVGDAFFPLLFLGWGQCETLLRGDVAGNVLTTVLACLLLVVIAFTREAPPPSAALVAGVALILLPLSGGTGLSFVPPLALWLTVATRGGRAFRWVLGLAVVALALTGAYVVGLECPSYHPRPAGPPAALQTTAEFLAMAFGTAAHEDWARAAWGAGAVLVVDAALLLFAIRVPAERTRALGLAALLAALLLLALEVGISRSGFGPRAGLAARYAVLAAPLLAHAYVVWELYAPRVMLSPGRVLLLAALVLLVPAGVRTGWLYGNDRRARSDAFERDLRAGLPAPAVARLHAPTIFPDPFGFTLRLEALRLARVRGFEGLIPPADDWSGLRVEPLVLDHVMTNQMDWSDGRGSVRRVSPRRAALRIRGPAPLRAPRGGRDGYRRPRALLARYAEGRLRAGRPERAPIPARGAGRRRHDHRGGRHARRAPPRRRPAARHAPGGRDRAARRAC